jgi:hypothetical protein
MSEGGDKLMIIALNENDVNERNKIRKLIISRHRPEIPMLSR